MAKQSKNSLRIPPAPPPTAGPAVKHGAAGYVPALWEKIVGYGCAVSVIGFILFLVVRNVRFEDPNYVIFVRILLSLACAVVGGIAPGFLGIDWRVGGLAIRAGGALAIFVITFFWSPKVVAQQPLSSAQVEKIEKTTEKTGTDVERMLTVFSEVLVQVVYELPAAEPQVAALHDGLVTIVKASGASGKWPKGFSRTHSGGASTLTVAKIDADELLSEECLNVAPGLLDARDLIGWFHTPRLQVGINRSARPTESLADSLTGSGFHGDIPDLHLFVTNHFDPSDGNFATVILDLRKDKVLVVWNAFRYPKQHWATSRKVVSVHDLGGAQLATLLSGTGSVNSAIDRIAARAVPIWTNLKFDNHFVSFTDLKPARASLNWQVFHGTFPTAESILANKATGGLDSAYSWGF